MSVLEKLTEGIVDRDLQKEGAALLNKWEATGLLEGIESDPKRNGMARLLENQAKQLLKEASSMAGGDVEGFAAVAFPIVRRVFGGLIANDLVSVQPMSLPSGLIFFLDFTYTQGRSGLEAGESLYGGGVVGQALTGGVTDLTEEAGGFYNHANFYSHATASVELVIAADVAAVDISKGEITDELNTSNHLFGPAGTAISSLSEKQKTGLRWDPDVLGDTSTDEVYCVVARLTDTQQAQFNMDSLGSFQLCSNLSRNTPFFTGSGTDAGIVNGRLLRRLTERGYRLADGTLSATGSAQNYLSFYVQGDSSGALEFAANVHLIGAAADNFGGTPEAGSTRALGAVAGAEAWGLEGSSATQGGAFDGQPRNDMPEIDIKVDSVSVTAVTKKLKAKWTPELGQDLNAYHNLDAEVELTGILSEQIGLEIDREILNDLIKGATAGTYYWSRSPGLFVTRDKGTELGSASAAPDFTGTVSEWYETLVETINDVSAQIHRKTLRGGATFLVTSPEVANILEFTSGFRASVTHDDDRGTVGAVKVGAMSKKWDVYVDPYFPRNLVLLGRNGGSFLESGYVYAPYVPLQVTPTIFGVEDFVPRKGVMTRYAKKMVRPDMYGLVVVRGLLGEAGAST